MTWRGTYLLYSLYVLLVGLLGEPIARLPKSKKRALEGRHIHTHSLTYLTQSLTYTSIHKYTQGLLIQGYAADEAIVVHLMQQTDRYAVRKKKNCGGVRDTQPSSLWVSIMSYRATAGHSATLSSCTVKVTNNHTAAPPPPTPPPPPPTRYSPSYGRTT